jgi:hypothetical protein
MTTILNHLHIFFKQMIRMSSGNWDLRQNAAFLTKGSRSFRILEAVSGNLVRTVIANLTSSLDASSWSHLPLEFQTYQTSGLAYAMIARALGGIEYYFGFFNLYPWRLFLLLVGDASQVQFIAAELEADSSCMFDEFTTEFRKYFRTASQLASMGCSVVLHILALILKLDTFFVERGFAMVRRMLTTRSMSWAPTLRIVSADFMLARFRMIMKSVQKLLDVIASPSKLVAADLQSGGATFKKTMGGGPARAFAHHWLANKTFSAGSGLGSYAHELTLMWTEYRRIKAECGKEWQKWLRKGETASVTYQATGHSYPAASPKPANVASASSGSAAAPCDAIVPYAIEGSALAPYRHGLFSRVDLQDELNKTSKAWRGEQAAQLTTEKNEELIVEKWSTKQMTSLAEQQFIPTGLQAEASPVGPAREYSLEWVQLKPPIREMTSTALQNLAGKPFEVLRTAWETGCNTVRTQDSPDVGAARCRKLSLCWHARMCVCNLPNLRSFVHELVRHLRPYFHKKNPVYDLYEAGFLLFRISFEAAGALTNLWAHISRVNLSTFHAEVNILEEDVSPYHGPDIVLLQSLHPTGEFKTWYQAFQSYNVCANASIQFFTIFGAPQRQTFWAPKNLYAEALVTETIHFWFGPYAIVPKQPKNTTKKNRNPYTQKKQRAQREHPGIQLLPLQDLDVAIGIDNPEDSAGAHGSDNDEGDDGGCSDDGGNGGDDGGDGGFVGPSDADAIEAGAEVATPPTTTEN